MDLQLKGKKALVTGSTAGIGFAAARALAAEGAAVIVNGRTQSRVDAAISNIKKAHPDSVVSGVAADVSNGPGCERLARAVPAVDILVNNMGIFEPKPFEQITDEEWLRFFEANVLSGVRLSRHYSPGMKQKNWGRILFVSSESAVQIPAEMIHYGMTKTAQVAVARGIAETTAGTGNYCEQRAGGSDAFRRRGSLHLATERATGNGRGGIRAGILPERAANVSAEALRVDRRGREHDCLFVESIGVGDEWGSRARRRRRYPRDPVTQRKQNVAAGVVE